MKKIIALTLTLITIITLLCSCNLDYMSGAEQDAEISMLKAQIEELKNNTNKDVETVIIEVEKTIPVEVTVPVEVEITVPVPITEVTKPVETTPVNTPNETSVKSNGITIIYPTKATLNYSIVNDFTGSKTRYSTCEVSDIKVEYSPSSFLSFLKMSFTVKKTYDKDGNNDIDSCEFRYRLKDETTGLIVADSFCCTTKIAVDEATKETESIFEDLIIGHTYRIIFYDYEF